MSIQFGDILRHNNPNYPIADVSDIRGGLRSIATFSGDSLISEYTSGDGGSIIPEKYKSGYSLLLETSTGTIYYYSGIDPTNVNHWTSIGIGGNGVTNTIPKWISPSKLGNSSITDNGDTVVISSNLMVIGTTSTINTENLLVKDPIILLAGSQSGTPMFDAGLFINRGSSDTQAFIWDESEKEFRFISTTSSATTSGDVSIGTYSSVRTGVLSVGTGDVDSYDRFIVSSSDGLPSLVIDEVGNSYNRSKGITNTLFGYGSQKNSLYDAGISIQSIFQGDYNYEENFYEDVQLTLYSGPAATTYPTVNIEVVYESDGDYYYISYVEIVNNGTGFTSNLTRLTADFGGGSGFYVTIDLIGLFNTSFGYNSLLSNFGKNNTAIGYNSLLSNTTGYNNTAMGASSSSLNTTGYNNTSVGQKSLYKNTTGYNNTAIGYGTLYNNLTGFSNTGIGYNSLNNNLSYYNTAVGAKSLYNNIDGTSNNAFGESSLYLNTFGSYNVGIGKDSLYSNTTGSSNIGIGYTSLYLGITSSYNIGIGIGSLYNTKNSYNIGIGYQSLYSNTNGYNNSAIGYQSLLSNTTGIRNNAIGYQSLYYNTTGYQNIAIGEKSLYNNTTATNSVAIGYNALYKNNTGNWNTALGVESLKNNTTIVTEIAGTFSPGNGYTPGTYPNIVLFGVGGSSYYPGNSVADYPQVTIVVGSGGTVSSATLTWKGTVVPDETVVFGIETGVQPYQIPGGGSGFRINILSIGRAGEHNVALGYQSLVHLKTGSRNVAIGSYAGSNYGYTENSSDSVYIGYNANSVNFDVSNEIVIGATALGNGSNTVTLGNDNIQKTYLKGNVGIGTNPSTKLHIYATQSGAFRLEDGTQNYSGYVLTSDANGVGTWQGNTQVTITTATATALPSWNNTTIMCNRSGPSIITIPDTGLPPNFSFRFIVISSNTSATIAFTYSSPAVSILPNTLLTFAQYESGVIDRLGTSSNYYITF